MSLITVILLYWYSNADDEIRNTRQRLLWSAAVTYCLNYKLHHTHLMRDNSCASSNIQIKFMNVSIKHHK